MIAFGRRQRSRNCGLIAATWAGRQPESPAMIARPVSAAVR
jgi:hypothetical protein